MKKIMIKIMPVLFVLALIQSCEEPVVIDESIQDLELKSASVNKNSYIVVLNDAELNQELAKLKGYEKKKKAVKAKSAEILERAGISDGEIGHVYGTAIKGFSVKIPPGQLKKLEADASVLLIEEDQVVTLVKPNKKPDKPGNPGGGAEEPEPDPNQETPWGITRVGGAADGTGIDKVAWVLDTGIDHDHPDLNVDASRGALYVRGKSTDDDNGHGSHVAGTIAAINNGIGVVGVAAGATVIPVKVLDRRGSGSYSAIIAGVDFVAANANSGDVANMSLGGGYSKALNDAVIAAAQQGIIFTLAAGNERTDANLKSPASANHGNIYTVSGCDINDNWYTYSNYGNPTVDVCAPGVNVLSCYKNGGYITYSGTSMSAPHVAGILLLGNISTDGTVNGDPDKNADPIAHL